VRSHNKAWIIVAAVGVGFGAGTAIADDAGFGPSNPFFAPSSLPFHAPPFDKIKDEDYLPAIEAGMAQQLTEIQAIANDPAAPTFGNTLVAMEASGSLLGRALAGVPRGQRCQYNPQLQQTQTELAPLLAAHEDAIHLDPKLFARISTIYKQRRS
jgi:peptidyl-dipeptidase Dcp